MAATALSETGARTLASRVLTRRAVARTDCGFTLIELMIVVAIIAIMAAIAYPSYTESVRRSKRADAKSALLENAAFMQRSFTKSYRYDLFAKDADGLIDDPVELPITQSPETGVALYSISLTAVGTTTFTLTADPVAGRLMAADPCGKLTLDHRGTRGLTGSTLPVEDCWGR